MLYYKKRKRDRKFSVVYRVKDDDGKERQKSEGFNTLKEAEARKKEIEYKKSVGQFVIPKCTKLKELVQEYVKIYGHSKWGVSTYDGNTSLINNYIISTIGDTPLNEINIHFMEKYYKELLKMPAVISTRNIKGDKNVTAAAISQTFIPKYVAQYLSEIKAEQDYIIEALGNEYRNYNLMMATTYRLPIGDSYLRGKMQKVIDEQGLPDVVFHSIRHTSITYKLKLSGGDIKSVQGDSGSGC